MIARSTASTFLTRTRRQLERALVSCMPSRDGHVLEAARYAVLSGGHRWRGLTCAAAGMVFQRPAWRAVRPFACAVELVHAAALTLDDLPSMDNATIRRGRPCVHKVFPAWAVDMLPAYLVNEGYQAMLNSGTPPERLVAALRVIAPAGSSLAFGQEMDLVQRDAAAMDQLVACYGRKTGSLFAAAAAAGAIVCGAGEDDARRMQAAGMCIGLAYQIKDDIADVEGNGTGKAHGMDAGRVTAVTLCGVEAARKRARQFGQEAAGLLAPYGSAADVLLEIIRVAAP